MTASSPATVAHPTATIDVPDWNGRTRIGSIVRPALAFRQAFLTAHESVLELASQMDRPGVVAAAVSLAGEVATVGVRAHADRPAAAIIGRHEQAHVNLVDDPGLALRHLALIVEPAAPRAPVRYRVIDLRSGQGFRDEGCRALTASVGEGPMLLRVASYVLVILPVPLAAELRGPAEAAWDNLPPRELREATVAAEARDDEAPRRSGTSRVYSIPGATSVALSLLAPGERAVGTLVLADDVREERILVGWLALCSGLLLGRYDRCVVSRSPLFHNTGLSRVHALVVEIAGGVYLVDTASTNGTKVEGDPTPVVRLDLDPAPAANLAGQVRVTWRWERRCSAQG